MLHNLMPLLAAMTWDTLESNLAQSLLKLFGGYQGLFLMGMLFVILVAFISIKAGAGFEATVILCAFGLFLVTFGVDVTGSGQNAVLPVWWLFVLIIGAGVTIYLAFFKRDF